MTIASRRTALAVVATIVLSTVAAAGPLTASADTASPLVAGSAAADDGSLPPLSSPGVSVPLDAYEPGARVLSKDGSTLYALLGGDDLTIIDTASRQPKARIRIPHWPSSLTLSPDGRTLYVGNQDGPWVSDPTGGKPASIVMIDTATNAVRDTVFLPGSPWDVSVSPDGSKLLLSYVVQHAPDWTQEFYLGTLDLRTRLLSAGVAVPETDSASSPSYSPDLTTAYFVGSDVHASHLDAIDLTTGAVSTLTLGGQASTIATTRDGTTAVIGESAGNSGGGQIELVDLQSFTVRAQLGLTAAPRWLQLSGDGSTALATFDSTPMIAIADTVHATVREVRFPAPARYSMDAHFLPDGSAVVPVPGEASHDAESEITLFFFDPATGAIQARVPSAGTGLVFSPDGSTIYSTFSVQKSFDPWVHEEFLNIVDTNTIPWHPAVARLSGDDRYATSVAVSQSGFPNGAGEAFVVSGEGFADALSASTAAAAKGGPLLLTPHGSVPEVVIAELKRLHPDRITVVGGSNAVSPAVIKTLVQLGTPVSVVSGADRYASARALVSKTWPDGARHLFIASARDFPDALSASSAAHASGAPLLVVPGNNGKLDAATDALITKLGATSFTIVGGTNAVSQGIANDLAKRGSVERLSGADRFETSAAVNAVVFGAPSAAYIASGVNFPDALSGGVLAAVNDAPVYVVQPSCVPISTADHLAAADTQTITLIGGSAVLGARAALLGIC